MPATIGEGPSAPEEMAARLARVRRAMGAGGIDALIVLAPDNQYWLCGLESFVSGVLPQALIVPAEDERQMLLQVWDADAPLARATATVEQIYGYRFGVDDPVQAFRAALDACAPGAEIVGFDAASHSCPRNVSIARGCSLTRGSSSPRENSRSCGTRAHTRTSVCRPRSNTPAPA